MRVLHVINTLGGSGGAEHGLLREVLRFSSGVRQLIVRLFEKDQLSEAVYRVPIPVQSLEMDSKQAGRVWPLAAWRLRQVIHEFEPDVVHSSLFAANLVAQISSRSLNVPVVSTFTLSGDETLLRRYQPGAGSYRAAVLRRIAAFAGRSELVYFRALTQDAKVTNCELLGVSSDRVRVIPRGVPLDFLGPDPKSRKELGLPDATPIILNVGRQTAQKGHVHLIRAFAEVRRKHPCHLVIVGREGDHSQAIHGEIQKQRVKDEVTIVGYTPHVRDYFAHASVFAFPSVMEGLGTALLEAMAAGVPIVAFDIPAVREVTGGGEFARLEPVGDEGALSAALSQELSAPDRDAVMRAGDFVRANYSIESISSRVEGFLKEVASIG